MFAFCWSTLNDEKHSKEIVQDVFKSRWKEAMNFALSR